MITVKENKTALGIWINEVGGAEKAAKLLGVTPRSISYWLTRKFTPNGKVIERITRLSKGRLTISGVIAATAPHVNDRGRIKAKLKPKATTRKTKARK